jgi:peptidoglycan/LPS O-acetylase OafA/YrhL
VNRDIKSTAKDAMPKRLASLDSLRAVAILMVVGGHMPNIDFPQDDVLLRSITGYWKEGGWVGVDLFFVLSGFLIGGLLFREFKQYGGISFGRFFIRRGLKIYPPFFAMIAVTIIVRICLAEEMRSYNIAGEILFLQNYLGKLWIHTWSLAVEEHFYILLPLVLFVLMRRKPKSTNPFARIPVLFLVLAVGELCLRVLNARYWDTFRVTRCLHPTHLRIDSLMFGVLGAYYYYFRHDDFVNLVYPRRRLLAGLGICLFLPAFFLPLGSTPFIYTAGFTLFYLGGGLVLAAMVVRKSSPGPVLTLLAFIGSYSYSIYLWHVPFKDWLVSPLVHFFGLDAYMAIQEVPLGGLPSRIVFVFATASYVAFESLYVCGSLLFGIAMGKLLEYPVLHLRDRIFPSRIGAVVLDTSSASPPLGRLVEATS